MTIRVYIRAITTRVMMGIQIEVATMIGVYLVAGSTKLGAGQLNSTANGILIMMPDLNSRSREWEISKLDQNAKDISWMGYIRSQLVHPPQHCI